MGDDDNFDEDVDDDDADEYESEVLNGDVEMEREDEVVDEVVATSASGCGLLKENYEIKTIIGKRIRKVNV